MHRLALLAFVALHLALVQHFLPWSAVTDHALLQGDDYDLHAGQVLRVVEGLRHWGHSWVYDVDLVAGQPEGTISDAGSKGWELWAFALVQLGASPARAFDSFVWLAMLVCPFVVLLAARSFGLDRWAALTAVVLASSLWFFDSFVHWLWWVGMVSYAFASHLALLALAFFYRFVERRDARWAAACAPLLGLTLLVHPYTFFTLALPMGALYLRALRGLRPLDHAALAGVVLVALGMNAFWLHDAATHWHYILNSAFYAQAGAHFALADFFEVLLSVADTGVIGVRTGFRVLTLGLAFAGLWLWRRDRERLLLPFALVLGVLLLVAYLGAHVPGATQIQPYRHIVPVMVFATLPAGAFVRFLARERVLSTLSAGARALLAVAAIVSVQHLAVDVLYFMPRAVPETRPLPDGSPPPFTKYGHFNLYPGHTHVDYRLPHELWLEPGFDQVARWVRRELAPGTRVLIDNPVLGERLAWKTDAEILGGFFERNTLHAYANFFRRFEHQKATHAQLEDYLRTFAVGFVITHRTRAEFEAAPDLLQPLPSVAGRAVYRSTLPSNRILRGGGTLSAATNRIRVRGSDPRQDLVLSYHYHPALRCEPGCRVQREQVALDAVGLMRIPAPHPRDLQVVNRY